MNALRATSAWIRANLDRRDLVGVVGAVLLWLGGERLYPGAGTAAAGAVLVAIAVLVR
jgi:hypothetical protein